MPRNSAIAEWEQSQRALAEAEIELIGARLKGERPSKELIQRVSALRDQAALLYDLAAAFLAPGFAPGDPGLDP